MGRPKGSRNKPKGEAQAAANGSAPPISPVQAINDENQLIGLFFQHVTEYERLLKRKKEGDRQLKEYAKKVRNDFGTHGVDQVKRVLAAKEDGGEDRLWAQREAEARVDRWLGLPFGTQGELLPKPSEGAAAFTQGKRNGLLGEVCRPPEELHATLHQDWINGWQDGQALLVNSKIKRPAPPPVDPPAVEPPAHGPDPHSVNLAIGQVVSGNGVEAEDADDPRPRFMQEGSSLGAPTYQEE